jgi:arsenite-transporting ATPase
VTSSETRVLLFTGKGGVGKTTSAAGTAALSAASGLRTLVMSTDAAHSLADALGVSVGEGATPVADNLFVQQVNAQRMFEESWGDIQHYLISVLGAIDVDPIAAEELTVIPGAEEILALLALRDACHSGKYDVVIVDCAPTGETLRLLALPEVLQWYIDKVLPAERRVIKALRPVLTKATGVPMPGDGVFDAIVRLHDDLADVRSILTSANASVRVVLTPESVVVAEARRSLTMLSLYGYRVDGVIANRVFPEDVDDPWVSGWAEQQRAILADLRDSFAGLPIWVGHYQPGEPVGVAALGDFARNIYGREDPLAPPLSEDPMTVTRQGDLTVLELALPFATKERVDLVRRGDELVVTVDSYRRLLTLPASLSRHEVAGAGVRDGRLRVRFRLDRRDSA